MYGRGEAVKLDLGGSGSGGVTDSEITVYGFWVKSWCNLISSTQAKRKRSEQTGKAYGQCKVSESLPQQVTYWVISADWQK